MKVGFILECGPLGADLKVYKNLVSRIRPDIEFIPITLDTKPKLINGCGAAARELLTISGCNHVYIIWDLWPDWREDRQRPCRLQDRNHIFDSLNANHVSIDRVRLVCVEEELEAWLITDGRALSSFLSRPTHKVKINHEKTPDRVKNPKGKLIGHFVKNRGKSNKYVDYHHAEAIVRLIPDWDKLRRSESFNRFYFKLTGTSL